jgi:hypothetical protein
MRTTILAAAFCAAIGGAVSGPPRACSGCARHVVNDWLGPIGGPTYIEIVSEPVVASGACALSAEPPYDCAPTPCVATGTLQFKNVSGGTIYYDVGDVGMWRPLAPGAVTKPLTFPGRPLNCGSSAPEDEISVGFSLTLVPPSRTFGYSAGCTVCAGDPF